jgi:hypothetical protein
MEQVLQFLAGAGGMLLVAALVTYTKFPGVVRYPGLWWFYGALGAGIFIFASYKLWPNRKFAAIGMAVALVIVIWVLHGLHKEYSRPWT